MEKDEWLRIHKELQFWGHAAMTLTFVGIAAFFTAIGARPRELAGTLGVLSLILFCAGLAAWAKRKGQSPVWGLMGLSCLVGVLVLRFLPKRCRGCGEARPGGSFDCSGCGAPL